MGKHILVLDDDLFTRKLIGMMLERAGYRVSMAANAQEAMAVLRQTPPVDAITCDLMMPDVDGLHFIETLKQEAQFAHIPVVVITAAGLQGAIEKAQEAGVAAIIEKPFLDAPLREALEKALRS
ncbi:MAG: response regulator [Anaerolineae bacterium]|nr:MAG: response regulator [Anaerolineae bacterium]